MKQDQESIKTLEQIGGFSIYNRDACPQRMDNEFCKDPQTLQSKTIPNTNVPISMLRDCV